MGGFPHVDSTHRTAEPLFRGTCVGMTSCGLPKGPVWPRSSLASTFRRYVARCNAARRGQGKTLWRRYTRAGRTNMRYTFQD